MSRSICLTRPEWRGDPENAHEAVVEVLLHGPRYIQVALELWALAGHDDRVKEIEALLEIAHERDLPMLHTEEVEKLNVLLDGLDQALKGRLHLDEAWQIPSERMDEVRSRTQLLHLDDVGGRIGSDGVMEGISEVYELRGFLEQASRRSLNLALG
jgi:hypothetical protein